MRKIPFKITIQLILIPFFLFSYYNSFGQTKVVESPLDIAKGNFKTGRYKIALNNFEELLKTDETNVYYNHCLAVCYLNTNVDKSKALPHMEFVTSQPKVEKQAWFNLGRAYHYNHQFDEAIKCFNKAINDTSDITGIISLFKGSGEKFTNSAKRYIEICENAKQLVANPIQVTFENLGNEINSDAADFYPFISPDETNLIFTSRRKGVKGMYEADDGSNTSDIFNSVKTNGVWSKPENMGSMINSNGDDEAVSVTDDGKNIFIYSENDIDFEDVLFATMPAKSNKFKKRQYIDKNLNQDNSKECSASMTVDGNVLLFSTNTSSYGGVGGQDILMTTKNPSTGKWQMPINLGENINTEYNEEFPLISKDGKTLYFASQGHNSMGGFDIFKSTYDDSLKVWLKAENLGYPINTTEDNKTISFDESRKYAYISALRKDGFGDLDIYRIVFGN